MRHRPREEEADATHHVMCQGNGRIEIVLDDRDRREFSKRFEAVADDFGWIVHTSSLMNTHHHAVVETPEPNLGRGMQRVLGSYAFVFNRRHNREGHLFHGPYWSRRLYGEGQLLTACLYAVLNPVAAGICVHPRDWPWCSYGDIAAGRGSERLMSVFGDDPIDAVAKYVEVVDAASETARAKRAANARALLAIAHAEAAERASGSG